MLGQLAGTSESYGNDNDDSPAAPDAVWIFDDTHWTIREAKSEAEAKGMASPTDVRKAGPPSESSRDRTREIGTE
ncbi:hypothetical protein ABGT92_07805 [Streptomyces cinereoruber]|uniref:hypothetical protein n=1 Tax=Streptomyces cinereoruber TaxID=67260 RepID=UPI00345D54E8